MSNLRVIFSSDEGVCVYEQVASQDTLAYTWAPSLGDITIELSQYFKVDETSLPNFLENHQCFETPNFIYLKMDEQFYKLSKRDYYADGIRQLIERIDKLLCVDGFVKMTPRQKLCLETILSQIIFQSTYIGPYLLLPIVSEIDYLNQADYEPDDISSKIKISTESPLWIETVGKIRFDTTHIVDLQYSYSYFCKNLLLG